MAFHFKQLEIPEVICVKPDVYGDSRGFFAEIYKSIDFIKAGIKKPFVQVNHSKSARGVLRGLHYQTDPMAQGKFVTVVEGEIFDVAVDIRDGSATYGRWVSEYLNSDNKKMLFVPEGFAHGFCVVSEIAQVIYYCTEVYSPEHEQGIIWNDSTINIDWPIGHPVLSEKDARLPCLKRK